VILVDTCVLVDVSTHDARWKDWSAEQLAHWAARGPLVTNPIVFAEWCGDFATLKAAEAAVEAFGLLWHELPRGALFLASRAHLQYRHRGGTRAMVLPDFLIGAHAAVAGLPLLTRDRQRFETYFSGLEVVAPAH
jgi:predicted nucleic acid-binding protein